MKKEASAIGKFIKGLLIDKKYMNDYGTHTYTVKPINADTTIKFLATTQLEELLTGVAIGKIIAVMYVSDRVTPNGSQKIFKLWVK